MSSCFLFKRSSVDVKITSVLWFVVEVVTVDVTVDVTVHVTVGFTVGVTSRRG